MSINPSILSELSVKQIVEEKEKLEKNIAKIINEFEEKTNVRVKNISTTKWSKGENTVRLDMDTGL